MPLPAPAPQQLAQPSGVPRLSVFAVGVLIRHRHCIHDIGYLDAASVRAILSHCNSEELLQIEDGTWKGSERDLAWYTWDMWYRIYEQKFGAYKPGGKIQLKPLPSEQPPDYVAPVGVPAPTADWRFMYHRDIKLEKDRAASVSDKLRNLYAAANKEKASRSVEVCIIEPPKKRARTSFGGPSSSGSGVTALVDKNRFKMLQSLGMSKPGGKPTGTPLGGGHVTKKVTMAPSLSYGANNHSIRSGGNNSTGAGGRTTTTTTTVKSRSGTVTRTVTVHKAGAAAPTAAAQGGAGARPGSVGGRPAGSSASTLSHGSRPGGGGSGQQQRPPLGQGSSGKPAVSTTSSSKSTTSTAAQALRRALL